MKTRAIERYVHVSAPGATSKVGEKGPAKASAKATTAVPKNKSLNKGGVHYGKHAWAAHKSNLMTPEERVFYRDTMRPAIIKAARGTADNFFIALKAAAASAADGIGRTLFGEDIAIVILDGTAMSSPHPELVRDILTCVAAPEADSAISFRGASLYDVTGCGRPLKLNEFIERLTSRVEVGGTDAKTEILAGAHFKVIGNYLYLVLAPAARILLTSLTDKLTAAHQTGAYEGFAAASAAAGAIAGAIAGAVLPPAPTEAAAPAKVCPRFGDKCRFGSACAH